MAQSIPLKILGVLIALWLLPAAATAEEITLQLNSGLKVLADYRAAARDKPAVLVLHGFLQTHHFSTVRLVVDELADAGYGMLAPTLSLNIDQRRTSLTCDAIQNHSVEQASAEIGAWVDWLKHQGYPRIILIGHSTGSNHLLSYLHAHPDPAVSAFIATSIGPIERWQHPEEERRQRAEAEAELEAGGKAIHQYSLGFCRHNYTAPAREFLSYLQWDEAHTLQELKTSPVPMAVILGEEDRWVRPGWADRLEHEAIPLRRIKGADHYFSGVGEFDFQASIISLVGRFAEGRGVHP